jgi:hypothetical protein
MFFRMANTMKIQPRTIQSVSARETEPCVHYSGNSTSKHTNCHSGRNRTLFKPAQLCVYARTEQTLRGTAAYLTRAGIYNVSSGVSTD